jgi:hypothetical protein
MEDGGWMLILKTLTSATLSPGRARRAAFRKAMQASLSSKVTYRVIGS